jgi:hypothetical protein
MEKGLKFLMILIFLLIGNLLHSQIGESKFKKVVVNSDLIKITQLYPSFRIDNLSFSDSNINNLLDGNEEGILTFYVKNTGTIPLKELNIKVTIPDSIKGIRPINPKKLSINNINDSVFVNIPVIADDSLKDGLVRFDLSIRDLNSDSIQQSHILISTKETSRVPVFTWINPTLNNDSVEFSIIEITGLISTRSNLQRLRVYINDQIPEDNKSFDVIATENINEYKINRTITLNDGENEIKIEARNDRGTVVSESRKIFSVVKKIDQLYAEKRLALVIGNADYLNSAVLQNPLNDAKSISAILKDLGFTVLLYLNTDIKSMKKAMDEFGLKLKGYDVGLFYYAGHGMQVKGSNYLIPVDASLKIEEDVEYDCVEAGRILGKMEAAGTKTNIVILDACRNNPFSRSWSTRSAGQNDTGLAFMNAPSGTIIAYATSPGKTASDGTGKNGIYTEAILKYIKVPSMPIEDFFKNVRVEVEKKSNKTQTPWESTSLKGNFYFKIY